MHRAFLHNVHVELASEQKIVIHCFCSNLSDLLLGELEEGVAAAACRLYRSRNAQFGHLTELLEEVLQLCLIKALRQMADVKDAAAAFFRDLELVEPT